MVGLFFSLDIADIWYDVGMVCSSSTTFCSTFEWNTLAISNRRVIVSFSHEIGTIILKEFKIFPLHDHHQSKYQHGLAHLGLLDLPFH
jgi:hypothetical protein